jgi:hypothetical protein
VILAPWQRAAVCSPPPWTPAAVPGCILYAGAYQEARATRAEQPTLVDGDMEAAGVAAWTAMNAATLSKQGDAHAGSQCLRVAHNGTANPFARQVVLVNGNRYQYSVAARGDGTKAPVVFVGTPSSVPGLTSSNAWQVKTGDITAQATEFALMCLTAAAGYAEFDSLTLANLSLQSYTPAFTTIPGSVLAQASATAQPWVSSDGLGVMYQADSLVWSAAASVLKCMHTGTGGTFGFRVKPKALNAFQFAAGNIQDGANPGFFIAYTNANQVRCAVSKGGGPYDYDSGNVACPIAIDGTYTMIMRVASGAGGVSLRVNGTEIISGALTAPSAGDPVNALSIGAGPSVSLPINGICGHVFAANRAIAVAECVQLETYIAAQATL